MKTTFLTDVQSGYEVMAIVKRNRWRLIRVQFRREGAQICYLEESK